MSIRQDRLKNGFRVVSEHIPGLQSAAIGIWVAAGTRHERIEQNGIAHFVEHMAFKGTKRRSPLQIVEAIEDVGGWINAYTTHETTAYFTHVLDGDVALAMDVIGDIVLNSVFASGEIEAERNVILQEIGQANDTPEDVILDRLQEQSYHNQALGRSILGPSERVNSFSREDLSVFIAEHYVPDKMILSAAGAVDHDHLMESAEQMFGHLKPRHGVLVARARFTGGEARQNKELEQAHFALALESPGGRDNEIEAARIYVGVLGGGMSSRLFQEVREKRGLCYTICAQTDEYTDIGSTTIHASTSADRVNDLVAATINELKRAAEDMTAKEIARARAQMKAGILMGIESPPSRAERLAQLVQIWGRVPSLEDTVAKIDAVTTADIRNIAERIAVQAPAALALYGPVARAPNLTELQEMRSA